MSDQAVSGPEQTAQAETGPARGVAVSIAEAAIGGVVSAAVSHAAAKVVPRGRTTASDASPASDA